MSMQDSFKSLLQMLIEDLKNAQKDVQQITEIQTKKEIYYFKDYQFLPVPNPVEKLGAQITAREKYEKLVKLVFQNMTKSLNIMHQQNFKLKQNYDYPKVISWVNQGYQFQADKQSYKQIVQNFDIENRQNQQDQDFQITRTHSEHLHILSKYPEIMIFYAENMQYVQRQALFISYIQYLEMICIDQSFGTIYESSLLLPPCSYLQTPLTKLIFLSIQKQLLSQQDISSFPNFYLYRSSSSLGILCDLMYAIIQEKSIQNWISLKLVPIVKELSLISHTKIFSQKFLDNPQQYQRLQFTIYQFLAKLYIIMKDPPEFLMLIFSIVQFSLKIFFDNIINTINNKSPLQNIFKKKYFKIESEKTSDQHVEQMMYNFKSTLVFGIIIRHICADPYSNNIFQDKQDEIILQNLLFVSDFVTEIALGQENGPFNIQQIQNPLDQEIIYWKQFTQSNCQQLKQIIQHLVNNIYVPDDDFDFIQKYLAQQPEDTEQKLVGNIWLIPSQLAEYIDSIRILYADFIKYSMNKYEKFVKQVLIKLPIQSTLQIQNINTFQYTVDQLQILSQISPSPKLKNIKILAVQFSDDLPIEIDHSISDKLYYMKENLTQVTQEFTQACQITILEPIFFKSSELTYYQNTCLRLIQIFEIENLIQSQISHIQSLQFENEDEFNLVFTDLQEQSAQIISKSNDNLNKMADFQDILDSYRYQSGLIERLVQILELILNDQSEPIYNNIDVEIDTQLIQDTLQELLLQDESSNLPLIQAIKWHNSSVNHVSLAKAKQFVPQTIFERVFMFKDQNQHDFNSEIKSKLYD